MFNDDLRLRILLISPWGQLDLGATFSPPVFLWEGQGRCKDAGQTGIYTLHTHRLIILLRWRWGGGGGGVAIKGKFKLRHVLICGQRYRTYPHAAISMPG